MTIKYQRKGPIVVFGAGHGAANIAQHLRDLVKHLCFIISVFDNGGHSRDLRKLGYGALGDLRRVLLALASDSALKCGFGEVFGARFVHSRDSTFNNAAVGNLILAALEREYGMGEGLIKALKVVRKLGGVRAEVLPVSFDRAQLRSIASATEIASEGDLDSRPHDARPIMCSMLIPTARVCPAADRAIRGARLIAFAPGSLWPSVLVHPMVEGVNDAIHAAMADGAKVVMITNIVMKRNEMDEGTGTSAGIVNLLCGHLGVDKIDAVLVNVGALPAEALARCSAEESYPVRFKATKEAKLNIQGDFVLCDKEGKVVHNAETVRRLLELCS